MAIDKTNGIKVAGELYSIAQGGKLVDAESVHYNGKKQSTVNQELYNLVAGLNGATHIIGITSTALTDGATTSTLTAASTGSLSKTTGFVNGDIVFYNKSEFVYYNSKWYLFGDLSTLGTLAKKNSASGSVSVVADTHTHSTDISHGHTVTQGTVSASGNYTPAGSVAVSGKSRSDYSPSPNAAADGSTSSGKMRVGYGQYLITDAEFTKKSIKGVGGTTTVQSITGVGTLPTSEAKTIPNVTSVGTLPTYSAKTIPNVTSAGTMFKASVSGEKLVLTPGTAPTLGTAISVNSMTGVGTLPTLGTAISVNSMTSAGSLPTRSGVTVATAASAATDFCAVDAITFDDITMPDEARDLDKQFTASFTGTQKQVSVSGNTSGVAVANFNGSKTSAATSTANQSKNVTVQ